MIKYDEMRRELKHSIIDLDADHYKLSEFMRVIDEVFVKYRNEIEQAKIGEWIPCSERLPEEDGSYLVTRPYYGRFITDTMHFYKGSFTDKYVCAWKPLPTPYEVESDE